MGGDGHGLEGDGGVDEGPAFGDGVVCGVCSDDCECAFADVAVEYAVADLVFDLLVGDEDEVPWLAVDGAGGLAACLQDFVDLLLGDWGLGVFSDGSAGQEGVDGVHGGCWGWGGLCVWRLREISSSPILFSSLECASEWFQEKSRV